ncbi:hypothetical protein RHS03_09635, partial [Rhizoctonia solani]
MLSRSTAGCYTCKRRKKKCDEVGYRQPTCFRCEKGKFECEGYAPFENPDSKGVMRRSKAISSGGPRQATTVDKSSRDKSLASLHDKPLSLKEIPTSDLLLEAAQDTHGLDQSNNVTPPTFNTPQPDSDESVSRPNSSGNMSSEVSASVTSERPNSINTAQDPAINHSLNLRTSSSLIPKANLSLDTNRTSPHTFRNLGHYSVRLSGNNISALEFWDTKPVATPGHSRRELTTLDSGQLSTSTRLLSTARQSAYIIEVDEDGEFESDESETEQEMWIAPTMDPNTQDNALPFVLQCYARWVNLAVFDPRSVVDLLKNSIIEQFMRSRGERTKVILLANVIGTLGKTINPNSRMLSLVSFLRIEAHEKIGRFTSRKPNDDRKMDMQNALEALDLMMEVTLIQRYCGALSSALMLMEASAPVFRRACPEPSGEPVNLPRVLASGINLRHFATNDIVLSITTGRPTIMRYDVTYPSDILPQITDKHYGLRWLHGISDQYIILLARINILSEDPDLQSSGSQDIVNEIASEIEDAWGHCESSDDSLFTIWKYIIKECWRIAMHVYLYMVLCRRRTDDLEIMKLVKSFVRLVESVRAGRMPDSFLCIPMIVVGASACRKEDQAVIHRRMFGLQEVATPGLCGNEALNTLLDVWMRADSEGRAAVWSDVRVATYRVTGI